MKDKFLLFPGWFRTQNVYKKYKCLNVWERNLDSFPRLNTKYLIAHSIGSIPALLKWKENPEATLILFNPLIPKRSLFSIFYRWLNMHFSSPPATAGVSNLKYLPFALWNVIKFLKIDLLKLIKEVPSDKLIILRGQNDIYFCDSESVKILQMEKIPFYEIRGVGHSWDAKVDDFINSLDLPLKRKTN